MIHRLLTFSLTILLIGLLAACVSQPQAVDTASDSSDPTLYGQLGVSIDHASVSSSVRTRYTCGSALVTAACESPRCTC